MSNNLFKETIKKIKKNKVYILAVIIFISLFIPLIINPSITGYAAYQDMKEQGGNVDEYTSSMNELLDTNNDLKNEINICHNDSTELETQIKEKNKEITTHLNEIEILKKQITELKEQINKTKYSYQDSINEMIQDCETEKDKIKEANNDELDNLEDEINDLESQIEELENEIDQKNDETTLIENRYNHLAQNAADNICCKMRFDNSNINYYEVINNKIICLETGTQEINCNI